MCNLATTQGFCKCLGHRTSHLILRPFQVLCSAGLSFNQLITFWIQIIHFYIGGLSTPDFLAFVNLMQVAFSVPRIMLVKTGRGHIPKL